MEKPKWYELPKALRDEFITQWRDERPHSYRVVDQNRLTRHGALVASMSRCRADGALLLLPDIVWHELRDHVNADKLVWDAMRNMADCGPTLVPAVRMFDLIREEIACKQRSERLHHDEPHLGNFRGMLARVAAGDRSVVTGKDVPLSPDNNAFGDVDKTKSMIELQINAIKKSLTLDQQKGLRKDLISVAIDFLGSQAGLEMVGGILRHFGADPFTAARLLVERSVATAFGVASLTIALHWIGKGGFDSVASWKVANDVKDLECIVLGACSRGVESDDKRLGEMLQVVSGSLQRLRDRMHSTLMEATI